MSEISSNWLQFLASHGARVDAAQNAATLVFDSINEAEIIDAQTTGFVTPLTELGLIDASGEDSANFLHNQITNDVEHLGTDVARRAAYCSPKGRMLASLLMWKSDDAIFLQLPLSLQPSIQKRLQMFVLRAKVKLTDQSATNVVLGLGGQAAAQTLSAWFPTLPQDVLAKVSNASGTLIRHPDAFGSARYMWIAPVEVAADAWPRLLEQCKVVPSSMWARADIDAAIAHITPATQEQFVPQMINFELIDGVNFKKGCYPGQEIVARSQYLGKLKRRMMLAAIDHAADLGPQAQAGTEIFSSADPGQPCGMVVNSAPPLAGQTRLLVEIKLAAIEAGSVHLGAPDGPELKFLPLPYALP